MNQPNSYDLDDKYWLYRLSDKAIIVLQLGNGLSGRVLSGWYNWIGTRLLTTKFESVTLTVYDDQFLIHTKRGGYAWCKTYVSLVTNYRKVMANYDRDPGLMFWMKCYARAAWADMRGQHGFKQTYFGRS